MDFLNPETLEDPYPHYQAWRTEKPIWWAEDIQAWVLSRYDDVRSVLKNAAAFSSAAMGEGEQRAIALPLLSDDPPRHTQLRAIVNKAFTSRTIKQMEGEVEVLLDELLDAIAGQSIVDISEAFTIPLPIYIVARVMGIPEERKNDFKQWSDALTGTSEATDLESRMPDILAMAGYFQSLIPERREHPGDDLISKIVHAEVNGEGIGDQDIVGFCMLLLIAGNETTTNLLSNLLNYLANDADKWNELRNDPSKIDAAIEEALRFDAPVHWVGRKATEDAEFHGQIVKAGDTVITVLGSANQIETQNTTRARTNFAWIESAATITPLATAFTFASVPLWAEWRHATRLRVFSNATKACGTRSKLRMKEPIPTCSEAFITSGWSSTQQTNGGADPPDRLW